MNDKDARVLKTRRAIQLALFELLEEKNSYKINISEISDKANINRKTFYNHYSTIDDVISDVQKSFAKKLDGILSKLNIAGSRFSMKEIIAAFTTIFDSDKSYYRMLCKAQLLDHMFSNIYEVFYSYFFRMLKEHRLIRENSYNRVTFDFAASGCLYTIYRWFDGDCTISADRLAAELENMVYKIFSHSTPSRYI